MATEQKIERIEDVRKGDIITLKRDEVTVEGPSRNTYRVDAFVSIRVTKGRYVGTLTGEWEFAAGRREVPEPEPIAPGTAGIATVRGMEGVPVFRMPQRPGIPPWALGQVVDEVFTFAQEDEVTDFVPDPTWDDVNHYRKIGDEQRQRATEAEAKLEQAELRLTADLLLKLKDAMEDAFEREMNLTFEGGIPNALVARVAAGITQKD